MRFIECDHGCYRIYAGALAAPSGSSGFVATLLIKIHSEDGIDEAEAFRDLALTNDVAWADESDAVHYAVRRGHYVIAAPPHRLAKLARRPYQPPAGIECVTSGEGAIADSWPR